MILFLIAVFVQVAGGIVMAGTTSSANMTVRALLRRNLFVRLLAGARVLRPCCIRPAKL